MANCHLIKDDIYWIGTNDTRTHLFERVFPIPQGVSYNSYLIADTKTALLDTSDSTTADLFLDNVRTALQGRALDYLIVNHMECDHSASIERLTQLYPQMQIVSTAKSLAMMKQFFSFDVDSRAIAVKEGSELDLGQHQLTFAMAPMVHWPEVMFTYDKSSKILFCADAFGTFGALHGHLYADEYDIDGAWLDEYRRYYANIVGKFGKPVQLVLAKAAKMDIAMLCPLHGPVWRQDLGYILNKYDVWSRYEPETPGVLVAYASMYGHTEAAAQEFALELAAQGVKNVQVADISLSDVSELVAHSFRFSHIALFSPTYNMGLHPRVSAYLHDLEALSLSKRRWVLVENGTWAPNANRCAKAILENMSEMSIEGELTIKSRLSAEQRPQLQELAASLTAQIN